MVCIQRTCMIPKSTIGTTLLQKTLILTSIATPRHRRYFANFQNAAVADANRCCKIPHPWSHAAKCIIARRMLNSHGAHFVQTEDLTPRWRRDGPCAYPHTHTQTAAHSKRGEILLWWPIGARSNAGASELLPSIARPPERVPAKCIRKSTYKPLHIHIYTNIATNPGEP